MHWLQTLDVALFRFINETLSNPVFDKVMPFVSGKGSLGFFVVFAAAMAIFLLWKCQARGRLCALMLALILWPGDSFVYNTIKHGVARPRPFLTLKNVNLPASKKPKASPAEVMGNTEGDMQRPESRAGYNSMPSSHAANWFAATMILLVYYRRTLRVMLPVACVVAFSRIYNGVHYPSDVLAGAIIGAGYAAAAMWALNALWQCAGCKWFPLWWEKVPSLVNPVPPIPKDEFETEDPHDVSFITHHSSLDQHWLRLGYLLIAVTFVTRLAYLASGTIQLTEDESYQWLWSKHPALSYYSKPPLIAYTQWLGTHLWGDTEFGVRFFSPIIGATIAFLLLRFFAREFNARAGFFLLLIIMTTPLMAVGSVLMTIDPLNVLFWTAAMITGWRAVQADGKTSQWLWTGLWMGLGFLSKYTELFQWLCWAVFFILWKPARVHLRKPGPYLALLVNLLCATPVLIWNQQHHWVTVSHVAYDAKVGAVWKPTLQFFFNFLASETALLHPIYFIAMIWAAIAFWRRGRHNPRLVFLFSMGAPVFLAYLLFTLHSTVLPNWIAPSIVPLFCLMVAFWDTKFRLGVRAIKIWLIVGLTIGFAAVAVMHDTNLIQKVTGKALPPKPDPLTRARAYDAMTSVVNDARTKLSTEGRPVFIIANHYGTTGELSFYLPEAKADVVNHPLVYCMSSDQPMNQFYFWPGYHEQRVGQNAIFVRELSMPPLVKGWFFKWLHGETDLSSKEPTPKPPTERITQEFESVTDLGVFPVYYRGRIFHYIQLFECRNLH
ncbi:MAG: hypothetical protein QOD03_1184 [Verrucomicrobiota bacterium]